MAPKPITVSVTRHVDPERAREVVAWARAGQDLLSSSPGYLGSGWVRPDPESPEWLIFFRFADAASVAWWQESPEREWWVASAPGMGAHDVEEHRTGIEGWFDTPSTVEVINPAASAPLETDGIDLPRVLPAQPVRQQGARARHPRMAARIQDYSSGWRW